MNMKSSTRILLLAVVMVFPVLHTGCDTVQERLSITPNHLLLKKGDLAYRYNRYEEAADYYKQVLDREPGNQQALVSYGKTMMKLGEPAKAASAFHTAAMADPDDADLVYMLAKAEVESGQYDRAFRLLQTRGSDNADPKAWILLAEYALQLDDPDTAATAIHRAIDIDGEKSAEPYLKAADLAERLGNDNEALRRLRQAYGRDPNNEQVEKRLREYGEIPGPSIALEPGN